MRERFLAALNVSLACGLAVSCGDGSSSAYTLPDAAIPDCTITGATYYIDPGSGDDANDGSSAAPWRTVEHGLSAASDGDGLLLRSGSYGAFSTDAQARADWVTLDADIGHTPVFERIDISPSTQQSVYLRLCNLTVHPSDPDPWPEDDGQRHLLGTLVTIRRADFVQLIGLTVSGVNKYLYDAMELSESDHLTLYHNDISVADAGVTATSCDGLAFLYNHVHGLSEGSGIRFQGEMTGTLVEGNHVHDCNSDEDDLYFPHNGSPAWHPGSGVSVRISNATFRNNIVHDGFSQSFMLYDDDGCGPYQNVLIENNLIFDARRIALYKVGSGVVVRNNTFVAPVGVEGIEKYDVLQRFGGILTYDLAPSYDGTLVFHNNLFVAASTLQDGLLTEDYNLFWVWETDGGYSGTGLGAHTRMAVWRDDDAAYTLRGNPNFYSDIGFTGETPDYAFAADGVQPVFVAPGFYFDTVGDARDSGQLWDFHLAAGSPAVNAGTPDDQPSDSLGSLDARGFILPDGPPRDAQHHSIGCYEVE